jgi:3-dehydro-L-gulonate 2-dehydrogenase
MRIPFDTMYKEFLRVLLKTGFTKDRAGLCASLFAQTSLDGVYSHGLNRFPLFIDYIKKGFVHIHAMPEKMESLSALERWDGNLGPGNLNAYFCMNRAVKLAHEYGIGCVALRNTNHWMRGGTYGWQAAEANCIGICFTNTMPSMPPWGGKTNKIGNNPLVMALPREKGHIVLDTAMSLFSYGKMDVYKRENRKLPFPGGYDSNDQLTDDPGEILKTRRPLPMGYWKGSGLAIMLDMIAAILSQGKSTSLISDSTYEYGLSQIFIYCDVRNMNQSHISGLITDQILNFIQSTIPSQKGKNVYYPGERTLLIREENLLKGIPADESIWNQVVHL